MVHAMKKAGVLSILFVVVVLLDVGAIAEAQQPKKVPRIGFLAQSDSNSQSTEAIRLAAMWMSSH